MDIRANVGKLLVAEPFLNESAFKRSVVLLTEHGPEGSMGFILNRPTNLVLGQILPDFPDFKAPVFVGGPVEQDRLNYIHVLGEKLKESKEICKGVFFGGDFDELKLLIDTKQVKPEEIRFFIGYAGWNFLQLEAELAEKSWIVSNASSHFVFNKKPGNLWRIVLSSMGARYSVFASLPDELSMN